MLAVNWFWEQHQLQADAGRFLVQLLPHRHQVATDLRLALWISLNAASVHLPEEFQAFGRSTDEIMGLLEECSDNLLKSAVWGFIGDMERAITLARAVGEAPGLGPEFCLLTDRDWLLGTELFGYAAHLLEHGEFARAAPLARENVALFQARDRYERAGGLGLLGHLALLQGDLEQAHQLHHAVAGPIRAQAAAALTTVRGALDPAVFAEAFATGQQLSLEEAYATILAPSRVTSEPTMA